MRPALSSVSLHHLPLLEALDAAAGAGFTALELLMIPGWVHLAPESLPAEQLAREVGRRGLQLIGVHGGGINGTSPAGLAISLSYLERLLPYIKAAGAEFLNINGEPVPGGTTPEQRSDMLVRIAEGLARLGPLAERLGLRISLENHAGCHIETFDDYAAIFARLPNTPWLGATLDTGHCQLSGVEIPALARALGGRLQHLHLKDHRHGAAVPLGEGEIDNAGLLRLVRQQGFRGYCSVELELADAAAQQQGVLSARPYLDRLIAAA